MAYTVRIINNISEVGLAKLPPESYTLNEDAENPQAILLRSQKLHDMPIPESLLAVGRAGAGVNNIPIDKMSEHGVVVFNAPGANANAVKELVLAGMLMVARNLLPAYQYASALEGSDEEIGRQVEKGKKNYVGFELPGRTLGVIGLGAIGVKVANAARALGMNVIGFDPRISIKHAWALSSDVRPVDSVDELLAEADFVSFHVPLIDSTRDLINAERISTMKDGAVVLNFSRDGIVNEADTCRALKSGKLRAYVCDFPSNGLRDQPNAIALPHLGASTREAEENCAVMVAEQVRDYLENGNILNAVNLPDTKLPRAGKARLALLNRNVPDMVGQISHILGKAGANIHHMINNSQNGLAYTLIDIDNRLPDTVQAEIRAIDGVLKMRVI